MQDKVKVVFVINDLGHAGAEKLLLDTIPHYNKSGIIADLIVYNSVNNLFLNQLKALKCCTIIDLEVNNVYNPIIIFKLMKYLKKYDIAHVHLFPGLYFVPIAKILGFTKIKLIYTEHNTTNRRLENIFFKWINKFVYLFYEKVVCISDEINSILKDYLFKSDGQLVVIENGVDITKVKKGIAKDLNLGFSNTDFLIVQVSNFREQKDQETLIKSLLHLPKQYKLLLAGNGPKLQDCKTLTSELNLDNRVFFLGLRSDIPDLLKSVHVIVLSSKHEGLSLSSIEAMASGRPFIASDVPGLTHVVKDAGVLFEQGNDQQLAKIIMHLMEDNSHYQKVVAACEKRAEEYDLSKMVQKHIKLYHDVAS